MIKSGGFLGLLLMSFTSFAMDDDGLSQECLQAMQNMYQFYYYEIQPNPKSEGAHKNERLSSTEALRMQVVISELKKNCPENIIARVNENLKSESVG